MIEIQTLQTVEAAVDTQDRPALFACLAARPAAVRAAAAKALLESRANKTRLRGGLARDFGREPEAVIMPLFAELSEAIGWQPSPAWPKFLASLKIDQEQWRDGIGYDLEALAAIACRRAWSDPSVAAVPPHRWRALDRLARTRSSHGARGYRVAPHPGPTPCPVPPKTKS